MHLYLMCITGRIFDGAVMHFLWIWFEVFRGIMRSQTKINQIRLICRVFAITQQNICTLQIGVYVGALMHIFIHIKLKITKKPFWVGYGITILGWILFVQNIPFAWLIGIQCAMASCDHWPKTSSIYLNRIVVPRWIDAFSHSRRVNHGRWIAACQAISRRAFYGMHQLQKKTVYFLVGLSVMKCNQDNTHYRLISHYAYKNAFRQKVVHFHGVPRHYNIQ